MNDATPRTVLQFPDKRRKADCQHELHVIGSAYLLDQLKRVNKGLDEGLTAAEVRDEWEARRCEEVIEYWAKKLAAEKRRSRAQAATFLAALASRFSEEAS